MDIVTLTNALTDIVVEVSEDEIVSLGLKKGFSSHPNMSTDEFAKWAFGRKHFVSTGGSPANVAINCAVLGLETALVGAVGDDDTGREYIDSITRCGVSSLINIVNGRSAVCYILVTPDKERTPVAAMGVGAMYKPDLRRIKTKFFHTSCYELASNPSETIRITEYMRKVCPVSIDLADPKMIRKNRYAVETLLKSASMVFATREEAEELTGKNYESAFEQMGIMFNTVCLKMGKDGSRIRRGKEEFFIPSYKVGVVNTNGAGDAYASGVITGISRGLSIEQAGYFGSYIASCVCAKKEAHL